MSCFNYLSKEEILNLKIGDKIQYGYWMNQNYYHTYYDKIESIDNKSINTEFGLCFINGRCRRNTHQLCLEKDEVLELKNNVKSYMTKENIELNKKLKNMWRKMDEDGERIKREWLEKNAIIEDKYRSKDGKYINYFNTLVDCIGYEIINNSLYSDGELLIKRCSKSIGKYKLYRKSIDDRKGTIPKWETSLIIIYNTETKQIKRDMSNLLYYSWYWLEREILSYDSNYIMKYDDINTNMYMLLKIYNDHN